VSDTDCRTITSAITILERNLMKYLDRFFMIAYKLIRKLKDGSLSPLFLIEKPNTIKYG
jgi:hypothetical protein